MTSAARTCEPRRQDGRSLHNSTTGDGRRNAGMTGATRAGGFDSRRALITRTSAQDGTMENSDERLKGKFFIGDYVVTRRHGHAGRVYAKFCNFTETRLSYAWFEGQNPRLDASAMSEPWYYVLLREGGSACVCESDVLEKTAECDMGGNAWWHEFYFGGCAND